ncbi:hypothetical protein R6Q57_016057 [Mikania cordata]
MKTCELCKSMARAYCESDRASLCWTCDAKVHSANFLVARHSRTLLCQACQSPTPWTASGDTLWPSTASVCRTCVVKGVSDTEEGVGEIDNQGPPAASSSGTDDCVLLKRKHQSIADISYEEEIESSTVSINHQTPTPEQAAGDMNKLCDPNIKSSEHVQPAGHPRGKVRRGVDFDLNLSAVEY